MCGTREVVVNATIQEQQLNLLAQERQDVIEGRKRARKWFYTKGGLTKETYEQIEREAKAKQDLEDAQKQERNINRVWREDRDFAYRQGVKARKQERDQKREIRNRLAKGMIIE
jgi:hypothetical protein